MTAVAQADSVAVVHPSWRPEVRVLLACAREDASFKQSLAVPLDWDRLLLDADRHGFNTLLHRRLTEAPGVNVPSGFRSAIAERNRASIQRGLQHTAVLGELTGLFREAGVTALPYKGPALSAQIFGDAAFREAEDLDILVPGEDVNTACQLLEQRGFRRIRSYRAGIEKQLLRYRAEVGMEREGVLVELQWRLAPQYFSAPVDVRGIAARACGIAVAGAESLAMSAEDSLVVLSVHGAKHHWQCLKWLLDIDLLVRKTPELSWERLQQRAAAMGASRLLGLSLSLGARLFATPIPPAILEALRGDQAMLAVEEEMLAGLQSDRGPTELGHHRMMLKLRERLTDRVLYVTRLVWQPTESEWDAVALPRALHFGYHFVRAGRVLAKALRLS